MMWPYYNDGANWLWMSVLMIIFWGSIIALIVWTVRTFARPRPQDSGDDAVAILRKRFAAGEITQDEFEKSKRLLQS